MADTGWQPMVGEGEYLLSGYVHITTIVFRTLVPTIEVDYRSTVVPRKQLHAGWIGLCSGTLGTPSAELTVLDTSCSWFSYFDFESNVKVQPSQHDYDDRIIWDLPTGIEAEFIAYW